MSVYAFIFARGGSKGLPGKNIKTLGGIPLIGHSIQLARQVEAIDKIYVSTDSDEIASVAEDFSAKVIKRPEELARDSSPEWLAWKHAVNYLHARGERFDVFVSLPTTSPLRGAVDVNNCLNALDETTDVVITVTPAARSPYFNMVTRDPAGHSKIVFTHESLHRRQDAPVVYDITTVAYVSRPQFILNNDSLFSGCVKSVIVPKERAIDIDDVFDFQIAEALYGNLSL